MEPDASLGHPQSAPEPMPRRSRNSAPPVRSTIPACPSSRHRHPAVTALVTIRQSATRHSRCQLRWRASCHPLRLSGDFTALAIITKSPPPNQ
ncbi:hypothetical protein BV898_18715 [Hypsibius exemplaris]|uniref:Uncharacterized protein n=1 Tax=Hypsibius exemplaris TaxID=2072580 RepID=A0A9X6RNT1_HYPEX|nr:hypothetical protein BV898_18715 [Hypsibius exemplaris]